MRMKIIIFLLTMNAVCESYNQIGCGVHKNVRSIIVGGEKTVRGEQPWKAALIRENGQFFCGGSLVSNKAVLTAAHCIKGKDGSHEFKSDNITVVLGAHDLSKKSERGRVTVGVESIQVHPDWNIENDSYDADIALLILNAEVPFGITIQPICLSKPESPVAQATEGIVVGYGKTESGNISNIAKKLKAPIKSFHDCVSEKEDLRPFLTARTFCGGPGDGKGVCEGDSGSGLYVFHNNRFYLRGTASASTLNSINECDVNTFAIFVDTTEYCGWIRSGGLNKYAQCSENDGELKPEGPEWRPDNCRFGSQDCFRPISQDAGGQLRPNDIYRQVRPGENSDGRYGGQSRPGEISDGRYRGQSRPGDISGQSRPGEISDGRYRGQSRPGDISEQSRPGDISGQSRPGEISDGRYGGQSRPGDISGQSRPGDISGSGQLRPGEISGQGRPRETSNGRFEGKSRFDGSRPSQTDGYQQSFQDGYRSDQSYGYRPSIQGRPSQTDGYRY